MGTAVCAGSTACNSAAASANGRDGTGGAATAATDQDCLCGEASGESGVCREAHGARRSGTGTASAGVWQGLDQTVTAARGQQQVHVLSGAMNQIDALELMCCVL